MHVTTSRRRTVLAALVVAAALSTSAALGLSEHTRAPTVAVAGPVAVHQPTAPTQAPSTGSVATPGAAELVTAPMGPTATVPILVYHYVRLVTNLNDALGIGLSVTPTLFAEEMALLRADGAHPITLAQLMTAMESHTPLPQHPVVLTFDDGYADFATVAEPILARYGFVATSFVVSGFLTRPGFMTAAQVVQMDRDGMVIGSHTVNHVNLAELPPSIAAAQIDGGKATLESLLGHPVLDFAYPYGRFNATTLSLVRAAGFRDAVTTMGGSKQSLAQPYLLRRWHMGGVAQGLSTFASIVGLPPPTQAQLAAAYQAAVALVGVQPPQEPPYGTAPRRSRYASGAAPG
ncbi:MAG: polysaccharide deacetylase family protein [Candidatus Dormibacteria bacterium]